MANTKAWMDALKRVKEANYSPRTADEVYSKVKSLGLRTVEWDKFTFKSEKELLERCKKFMEKNAPCLFIYESETDKDFLFGISEMKPILEWIEKNKASLHKYTYLMTTTIINPGNGFVGSIYSDGKGKILCETLHLKGVCNHRTLSQPKQSFSEFLDFFVAEDFELVSLKGKFLNKKRVKDIIDLFWDKEGYFEFVYGNQNSKVDFYTTGIEDFSSDSFPEEIHLLLSTNPRFRLNKSLIA